MPAAASSCRPGGGAFPARHAPSGSRHDAVRLPAHDRQRRRRAPAGEGVHGARGRARLAVRGEPPRFAAPGETVVVAPGMPRRFWNAGPEVLRCDAYVEPAHDVEYLRTEL